MLLRANLFHIPILIDILYLVDLLLDALTRYTVWLQLINLLINQIRDGFVEVLQKILDHFRDYVVGLLLILPLKGKVGFRITYREMRKGGSQTQCITVLYSVKVLTTASHIYTILRPDRATNQCVGRSPLRSCTDHTAKKKIVITNVK